MLCMYSHAYDIKWVWLVIENVSLFLQLHKAGARACICASIAAELIINISNNNNNSNKISCMTLF